jgi:hypothetical protein
VCASVVCPQVGGVHCTETGLDGDPCDSNVCRTCS